MDVPEPGWYITRPAVNAMGLGLGAEKVYLEELTTHLPLGHFWCEWFDGRHFSVDYTNQQISLIVEGIKPKDTLIKWSSWKKVDDFQAVEHMLKYPKILDSFEAGQPNFPQHRFRQELLRSYRDVDEHPPALC